MPVFILFVHIHSGVNYGDTILNFLRLKPWPRSPFQTAAASCKCRLKLSVPQGRFEYPWYRKAHEPSWPSLRIKYGVPGIRPQKGA